MASPFISTSNKDGSVTITNGGKECLVYSIEDLTENIYISRISKCSDGKPLTREVIKVVENLAVSKSDIRYIYLDDKSSINVCTVPLQLYYLKILTTGESWYNSIGYKSSTHDDDVAHNAVIINRPMGQLLSELSYTEVHMFPGLPPTLENLQTVFPGLSEKMTVKEYVTAMSNELPRSGTIKCTPEQIQKAKLLYNLIDAISGMLRYEPSLHKIVHKSHARGRASQVKSYVMSTIRKPHKPGMGGAKITIRKSRRKTRTRKYNKRKTA
jgi:hypothetical protein